MTNKGWPKDIRQKNITHKYIILDSVEEVEELKNENLRKSALSKLSPDEIKALGL
jgi:ribosomal protein L14E/L6E/L27E